jgi:hypothetical protein
MTTREKQLIDLCRDLVKAITKENYGLVIRFHNLEQEMDAAPLPVPEDYEKPVKIVPPEDDLPF